MTSLFRTTRAWFQSHNYQTETTHNHELIRAAREQHQRDWHIVTVARATILLVTSLLIGFTGWTVFTHSIPGRYQLGLLALVTALTFTYGILEGWRGNIQKKLDHSIHLNSPTSRHQATRQVEQVREHVEGWLGVSSATPAQKETLQRHLDQVQTFIDQADPWRTEEPKLRTHLYQELPQTVTEHVPSGKSLTREETHTFLTVLMEQQERLRQLLKPGNPAVS